MFQESFKGVVRNIEGCFNGVLSWFQVFMKEVQRVLEGSFKVLKEVSRKFCVVFRKFSRQLLREFKGYFIEILICNFAVALLSLQLPEQKEGLFVEIWPDFLHVIIDLIGFKITLDIRRSSEYEALPLIRLNLP